MRRRTFLAAGLGLPVAATMRLAASTPRRFEVVTRVNLPDAADGARAWVPLPWAETVPYQTSLGHTAEAPGATTAVVMVAPRCPVLQATWPAGTRAPSLAVTARVETRGHAVEPKRTTAGERPAELTRYLQPTRLIPTDGIVREHAQAITGRHRTLLAKARAIYDWIVERTARDPEVKGCGLGDIRWMLETGNLRGKCADLNALFVGLARASGLPARDLYGLRVAPSTSEFASLGRAGGDVTTAQHCRAEVYVEGAGWVPVDPADVRKVMLDDHPGVPLTDPRVAAARERLFGSWEMNWFAYNDAHDVVLPGARGPALPFLMYPQAELGGEPRDSLDPAAFRYTIHAAVL